MNPGTAARPNLEKTMFPNDLTGPVHKALRRFMFDTLVQSGSLDVTRRADVERTLNLVERLLGVLREPAPGLRSAMAELQHAPASGRAACAARLYRELSGLVTRELARLQAAEEIDAERPPRLAGVTERARLRRERLATLDLDELRDLLGWMADALSPQELAALLDDLHDGAPTPRLSLALDVVSRRLPAERWQRLAAALGLGAASQQRPPLPLAA